MKTKTLSLYVCLLMLTITIAVPVSAQKKNGAKPLTKGYGQASYTVSSAESYMSSWLVAGPVPVSSPHGNPTQEDQVAFFKEPLSPISIATNKPPAPLQIKGKQLPWQQVNTSSDIVDLDQHYSGVDFSAAFAVAEIKAERETKTFLGVGSDDGIRIWHNGKLIHDNWTPRGVNKDDDLVPITLQPGSNQILLKVQDIQQGWGFVVRFLNNDALSDRLINAAGIGDLDQIEMLLQAGVDVNRKNASGLTASSNARINGREEVAQMLAQKGATESAVPASDVLISGLYDWLEGKNAAGVAVLVSKDGQVIYKNGFGYADIEKKEPVTTETKFRIGSVTKQFTSAAILKLQEQGKLSVNDKLSKFLPDFPRAEEVTIHHLLTHTSGIHSYTGKPDFINRVTSPITEGELIAFFMDDAYDFNPGERWLYNNSAYFLLGHIIGKVSGKPYAEYLKETFFDPIGMTNTGVHTSKLKLDKEAKGYTKENGEYKLATNWDMSWAGGAGALYSTVEDLYRWNEALYSGKVLKEESLKSGLTPVVLNHGNKPDNASYGYGWAIANYRGQPIFEHSGGLHGFLSQLARYPDDNLTIVLLTNLTPPEVSLSTTKIAEFVLWQKMDKQDSKMVNMSVSEDVTQYVGRYDFGNGAVMMITAENNNLFAQLSGQPRFPIFPSGEGEYFWKVVNAKIKFVKDNNGEVERGDFEQNGNKLRAPKIKERPVVSIDKSLYKLYSGKYDYGNNMVITISAESDKLYAQATNQPKFEIMPVSEEEFIVREINASLRFVKEADGRVSKLILDMGGQKMDVARIGQ